MIFILYYLITGVLWNIFLLFLGWYMGNAHVSRHVILSLLLWPIEALCVIGGFIYGAITTMRNN